MFCMKVVFPGLVCLRSARGGAGVVRSRATRRPCGEFAVVVDGRDIRVMGSMWAEISERSKWRRKFYTPGHKAGESEYVADSPPEPGPARQYMLQACMHHERS